MVPHQSFDSWELRRMSFHGIEYAGVAAYLGDAEESNVNLFI
jgi:peroxiredoxin family protein